jgi:hypothetical protein
MCALYAQYVFLIACLSVSRQGFPFTPIAITVAVQIRYHLRLQLQLHSKLRPLLTEMLLAQR